MLLPLTPGRPFFADNGNEQPQKPNEASRNTGGATATGLNGISISNKNLLGPENGLGKSNSGGDIAH